MAFPTLGSSPRTFFKDHQKCDDKYVLTSLSKREKSPEWFDVFNLKECELLLVATAILIWGLTDRE